jgi:hypothetical protein
MSDTPRAVSNPPLEPRDQTESWNMRLYVAGQTPKSLRALANLKQICEAYLAGKYHTCIPHVVLRVQKMLPVQN